MPFSNPGIVLLQGIDVGPAWRTRRLDGEIVLRNQRLKKIKEDNMRAATRRSMPLEADPASKTSARVIGEAASQEVIAEPAR